MNYLKCEWCSNNATRAHRLRSGRLSGVCLEHLEQMSPQEAWDGDTRLPEEKGPRPVDEHPEHLCKLCITGEPMEHTFEPALYALWHGGGNYSRIGDQSENVEVFNSVESAATEAWNRMHTGHNFDQHFALPNGVHKYVRTPSVDDSSEVQLFYRDPRETGDWSADITLVYYEPDDAFVTEGEAEDRADSADMEEDE